MVKDHLGIEYNLVKEMCDAYGINPGTYSNRIKKGWTQERALTEKVREKGKTLRQFCMENDLEIILEQFDDEMNYPETVDTVAAKSDRKMYFTYDCPDCHTAHQRLADKTGKRSIKCPKCQNRGGIGKSIQSEYPNTYALMFIRIWKKRFRLLVLTCENILFLLGNVTSVMKWLSSRISNYNILKAI